VRLGQGDLETFNYEVNLSQEKGQTYNGGEHGRKKATDNLLNRVVHHAACEQRSGEETHSRNAEVVLSLIAW